MKPLHERIRQLAPQYQPDQDDLRWFDSEIERVIDKAVPRLVRKRFVARLNAVARGGDKTLPIGQTQRASANDIAAPATVSVPSKA